MHAYSPMHSFTYSNMASSWRTSSLRSILKWSRRQFGPDTHIDIGNLGFQEIWVTAYSKTFLADSLLFSVTRLASPPAMGDRVSSSVKQFMGKFSAATSFIFVLCFS